MWEWSSLNIPIWVGIFAIGFQLGGGGLGQEEETYEEPTVEQVAVAAQIVQEDLEWTRCGQYGLDYWEPEEVPGFYNCIKRK